MDLKNVGFLFIVIVMTRMMFQALPTHLPRLAKASDLYLIWRSWRRGIKILDQRWGMLVLEWNFSGEG